MQRSPLALCPDRSKLESLYSGTPFGALTTGKSLAVPSWGGRYHTPSVPTDLHWESSLVPAWLLIGSIVADVAAQLAVGKPAMVTVVLSPLSRSSVERPSARKMSGSRSGSTTTNERLGKTTGRDTAPPPRLASRIEPNSKVVRSRKSAPVNTPTTLPPDRWRQHPKSPSSRQGVGPSRRPECRRRHRAEDLGARGNGRAPGHR